MCVARNSKLSGKSQFVNIIRSKICDREASNSILIEFEISMRYVNTKEFCNGGRGLSAARGLQATPPLQTSLVRECVRAGAAGAGTRRSLGYHLLHPLIMRLLVLCVLGVSPSLVSRWCEGYSFWSS